MSTSKVNIFCFTYALWLMAFMHSAHAEGSQKIVKWKDDKGVTHYGDVLPSQDSGRGNAVLNKEGVVIKKNQSYAPNENNKEAETASAEQIRQDSALLASYSSVEEIDLALERNLQTEENALKVLRQRLIDTRENLKNKQVLYDAKIKNKQKPSKYLQDEIQLNRAKITRTEAEIIAAENNVALIQARFAKYKTRYAELRPRNQSLTSINVNKKNLTELELWKKEANEKLSYFLNETVKYKRAGTATPNDVFLGIQQANQEIARADQEIAAIRANIKNSQQSFSSK